MVWKSGQIFLPFCHNSRVWQTDRQTDGRTDRILIAIPRLHYMQCGNYSVFLFLGKYLFLYRPCKNQYLPQNRKVATVTCRDVLSTGKLCYSLTIVRWISVHPYKATYFENRKRILHFIAFMVLHTDSHQSSLQCWYLKQGSYYFAEFIFPDFSRQNK